MPFLRKYGTGTGADVIIPIIKRGVVDFAVTADWSPASGDVKVSKDGGTEANIGTLPVINGTSGWKFVFADAELQCKSLTIRVVDSATKAIEDQFLVVETYGHASAMYPVDLSASVLPVNVTHFGGTAGTFDEGKPTVELDSASVDAIWNEVLTGATHNIASSAGRRLRQLADTVVLVDGVCDAASNEGTDSTGTITLEVGTTTACIGQAIRSENQVRFIASYDAGTRIAQLDRPWCVVPDAGDEYVIFNVRNPLVGLASLALAGSTAAAVNDVLVDTGTTLPAQIAPITDGIGWTLASLYGACANPQAADSLVQLTINGHDYSGQYSGLTATGVRTAPTLSKV